MEHLLGRPDHAGACFAPADCLRLCVPDPFSQAALGRIFGVKELYKITAIFVHTESSGSPGSVHLPVVIKEEGTAYLLENKWTSRKQV